MPIKLASWNIEGRLTRFTRAGRGSPEHIIATIESLDADMLFLAEASDGREIESDIMLRIANLGYDISIVDYEHDNKDRKWAAVEMPTMMLLSRLPVSSFRKIRLGGIRNALVADIGLPDSGATLRIVGVHLDDRNENYRMDQMTDLLQILDANDLPTVVAGDFNAMHARDIRARILRNKWIMNFIRVWPHARTRDMLERLSEMAKGQVLASLEGKAKYRDADPKHHATSTPKLRFQEWMPSIPLVQIDHMFVSQGLKVSSFRVGADGGSDHRPISAVIHS